MKKNIMGRQSGFTLVQATVFMAVVLVVGAGVYEATTASKQSIDSAKRVSDAGALGDIATEHMRTLLTETGAAKNEGVCRAFSTPSLSPGPGNIYIRLPATSAEDPFAADWDRAFPPSLWTSKAQVNECRKSALRRCYVPSLNLPGVAVTFLKREPLVTANLIPVNMRNTSGRSVDPIQVSPSAPTTVNARDVGFVVYAQTNVMEGNNWKTVGRSYSTVWTGQLTCGFVTAEGRHLYLNPSAIGSGGISDGTSGSGAVFSLMQVSNTSNEEVLDVNFRQYENTKWKLDGLISRSDYSAGTVSGSCRETRYRCPKKVSTGRIWEPTSLAIEAGAKYLANSKINSRLIVAKPEIYFSNGTTSIKGAPTMELSAAPIPAPGNVTISESPRMITARFADSAPICTQICVAPSYNTGADGFRSTFAATPRADYAAVGKLGPYLDQKSTTYCSCCADKQCARTGWGTRYNCAAQPPEPLDSRVSECEAGDPGAITGMSLAKQLDTLSLPPNTCVAASITGDGELAFTGESCGSSYAPVCYFQGLPTVARSIDTKNPVPTSFGGSRENCYKQGEEKVNKAEIAGRMHVQATDAMLATLTPYDTGSDYRFVNLATAGIFAIPESDNTTVGIKDTIRNAGSAGTKTWLSYRIDGHSRAFVPPPELENSFISKVGYYVEPTKKLVIFQDDATVTAGSNLILAHSRKFFGPVSSEDSAPSGSPTHVICRSLASGAIFQSSATTGNVSGAKGVCAAEDGIFLPPLTGTEWHLSVSLAAAPSPDYPWPNDAGVKNTAWLAYKKNGANWDLALAPPSGTSKVKWDGSASTSTATHRLCVKRDSSNVPSFKLIAGSAPIPACSGSFPDAFGAIQDTSIVDNNDMLLFLAKAKKNGDLNDSSSIDLNP